MENLAQWSPVFACLQGGGHNYNNAIAGGTANHIMAATKSGPRHKTSGSEFAFNSNSYSATFQAEVLFNRVPFKINTLFEKYCLACTRQHNGNYYVVAAAVTKSRFPDSSEGRESSALEGS